MPIRTTEPKSNTYRVLFEEAYFWPLPKKPSSVAVGEHEPKLSVGSTRLHNRKKTVNSKFLYGNSATWNKPVPMVFTRLPSGQVMEEAGWFWHHTISKNDANQSKLKTAVTLKEDETPKSTTQDVHGPEVFHNFHNPKLFVKSKPVEGIVPIVSTWSNDGKQHVWHEKISFEHIYESRRPENYPIRGKRQGAFVWERAKPELEKAIAKCSEDCWLESEKDLAYTRPMEIVGAAAMQGWADGLSVPSEQKAYQRQFAECKQPERTAEFMSRTDNVATLLQPDLYHPDRQVDRIPLFTR